MIISDTAFVEGIEKDLSFFGVALLRLNDFVCLSRHLHPIERMGDKCLRQDDQKKKAMVRWGCVCSGSTTMSV